MSQEPIPNMSANKIKEYFSDKNTKKDLADACFRCITPHSQMSSVQGK